MSRKKDDFQRHLEKDLREPRFAREFHHEREKLRIALKIAALREKRGLTQRQLAEKIHTTQSVISRLEHADYERYSIQTLQKIAGALQAELVIDLR